MSLNIFFSAPPYSEFSVTRYSLIRLYIGHKKSYSGRNVKLTRTLTTGTFSYTIETSCVLFVLFLYFKPKGVSCLRTEGRLLSNPFSAFELPVFKDIAANTDRLLERGDGLFVTSREYLQQTPYYNMLTPLPQRLCGPVDLVFMQQLYFSDMSA